MNVACNRHDDNLSILFVDFNQDFTSIQVGTKSGYSLLSTVGDQITETYSTTGDPICIVGRLFNRSLITLVSQNDMRKLLVSHSRINTLICYYRYSLTILAVKMNHQRLVVCVEDGIFIHNIRDMQMLHRVEETPPNRNGVIALSSAEGNCYLAYPGSHRVGMVYIFDAMNFQNVTSIAAHDGLLAALAFNSNATLLATASEKGTVIRVFSIPQGDRLMEFRRGLTRCVSICCLSFSLNNQFLVAASHTETVHVFKLESRSPNKNTDTIQHSYGHRRTISTSSSASQSGGSIGGLGVDDTETNQFDESSGQAVSNSSGNNPILPDHRGSPLLSGPDPGQYQTAVGGGGGWGSGLMGWMGSTLKAYSSYLPHQVSEIFAQDRAFAYARLPAAPLNSLWATATGRGSPVISSGTTAATDLTTAPAAGQSGGMHKVAAVVYYQNQPRLIVAGLDGLVHTFAIDPVNGGEANLLRTQRLLSPNPSSSVPRPIGQGHHGSAAQQQAASDHTGQAASVREPVGAHLTGGPQHPGVYVAPRSTTTGVSARATTFAGVVIGGTPLESDNKTPVSHPPEDS
ncbi:WD repeat domain phosphoinositide-interacting protein 2 [Paragonimus heterotremus]|uniref:WD repeat domain phosphoinositide-interacting protein 2 n=1 Tax=Paragonimus heterotremus TaxID=100268 RepID=A0A8J4SYF6_9TREM|nr:WD repeat domain phosphoinositide-interacting protein 2 [Paragonimus heterotremus]